MTTQDVVDFLRSVILILHKSRRLNDFIEAKNLSLVEVVVVKAIVEAVVDLFQTLAELLLTSSLEL
jgi:hypothetical protein